MREGQSSGRGIDFATEKKTRDRSQLDAADGQKEVRAIANFPSGSIPYSAKSYLVALFMATRSEKERKDFIISIEPARKKKKRQANFALDLLHRTAQVLLAYISLLLLFLLLLPVCVVAWE